MYNIQEIKQLYQPLISALNNFEKAKRVVGSIYTRKDGRKFQWNGTKYVYLSEKQHQEHLKNQQQNVQKEEVKIIEKQVSKDEVSINKDILKLKQSKNWNINNAINRIDEPIEKNFDYQYLTNLSDDEKRFVVGYLSSGYSKINKDLRENNNDEDTKIFVKNLDKSLQKLNKYEGTVHRSISFNNLGKIFGNKKKDELIDYFKKNKGRVVEFKEYLSTGKNKNKIDKKFGGDDNTLNFKIKSKNGRDLSHYNDEELEVLFERNSKFKVNNIKGNNIELEEIENENQQNALKKEPFDKGFENYYSDDLYTDKYESLNTKISNLSTNERKIVESIFGENFQDTDLIACCGGIIDKNIKIEYADISCGIYGRDENVKITLRLKGFGEINRIFIKDEKGKLKCRNNMLRRPKNSSEGWGSKLFSNQVNELQKRGFQEINCQAEGHYNSNYNGYYTWARLGYEDSSFEFFKTKDKSIYNWESKNNESKTLDKRIKNSQSLQELMSFPEGREFWKQYGESFEGKFDLSENSTSIVTLKKYINEKFKEQ